MVPKTRERFLHSSEDSTHTDKESLRCPAALAASDSCFRKDGRPI